MKCRNIFLAFFFLIPGFMYAEGSFFAGLNYSSPVSPRGFSEPWTPAFGYSAGLEQMLFSRCSFVMDINYSRFEPSAHYFSQGGRNLIMGGEATSFLTTVSAKYYPIQNRKRIEPYMQGGVGLSRFTYREMDLINFLEGFMTTYSGTSETRSAIRLGGGCLFHPPFRSILDVQADVQLIALPGNDSLTYLLTRLLICYRLP